MRRHYRFCLGGKTLYIEEYTEESFTKEFGEGLKMDIDKYGTKRWYNKQGQFHRLYGPAVEFAYGYKAWYQNGKLHRLDGPAVEWASGSKEWYQNGKLHRLDGPAIEYSDGDKAYFVEGKSYSEEDFTKKFGEGLKMDIDKYGTKRWRNNQGQLHRLDGPAVEYSDGDKAYFVEGKYYTEKDFTKKFGEVREQEQESTCEVDEYGHKRWYNEKGKLHRLDGHAVECADAYKAWYKNGQLHRLDGPAIECANGYKSYYVEGKKYTEEDFTKKFGEG